MAIEHLCLGCMSYLENPNSPCPNCGWFKTTKNSISQLQAGYMLTNENQTETVELWGKVVLVSAIWLGTQIAQKESSSKNISLQQSFRATVIAKS